MIEILMTVAALCSIHSGSSTSSSINYTQTRCQRQLLMCFNKDKRATADTLAKCAALRELD